jgi:hypothetical protein
MPPQCGGTSTERIALTDSDARRPSRSARTLNSFFRLTTPAVDNEIPELNALDTMLDHRIRLAIFRRDKNHPP